MKTILFASVIAAMILPFSMMDFAEAQEQTKSEKRFAKFLKLNEKQERLTAKLDSLIHKDAAPSKIEKIEMKIAKIQKKMDKLQQKEIQAVAIDASDMADLETRAATIMDEVRNPNSAHFLNEDATYFINQIDRSIVVTVTEDLMPDVVQRNSAQEGISGPSPLDSIDYEIEVVKKNSHFVNCSQRQADCDYGIGGIAIKQGTATSTLGFSAVQTDGDTGFVTVAHGVNSQGATVKQYPNRSVGTVDTIDNGKCDCAFVKTNSNLSTIYKVYTDPGKTSSITSYATSGNPSIGTWLMMTGVTSEVQYGQYKGWHSSYESMVTDYTSADGDSGAPVTTTGTSVKLYGMHHSNTSSGSYSFATPYNTIKTELSLQ